MAYIFDPIQGTFIDDKDKTLGNKLMLADLVDDLEPGPLKDEMQEDFDPSQETYEEYLQRKRLGDRPFLMADGGRVNLNTGSGLPLDPMDIDNKLQEVINAFKKLSPRSQNRIGFQRFFEIYAKENFATGGRVNLQSGTNIKTLNPLFPERSVDFMSDEFKPIDVPGAIIPPLAIGAAAKRLRDTFFSKDEDDDKKEGATKKGKEDPLKQPPDPYQDFETLAKILDQYRKFDEARKEKNKKMATRRFNKGPMLDPVPEEAYKIDKKDEQNALIFANRLLSKQNKETGDITREAKFRDLALFRQQPKLKKFRNKFDSLIDFRKNPNLLKKQVSGLKKAGVNFNEFFNPAEIASLMGLPTPSGVTDSIRSGQLPFKKIGPFKAVKLNDYVDYLTKQTERLSNVKPVDVRTLARSDFLSEVGRGIYNRFKDMRAPKNLPQNVKNIYKKYNLGEIEGGHPFPVEFFTKKFGKGKTLQKDRQFDWIYRNKNKLFDTNDLVFQSKDVNKLYRTKINELKKLYKELGPLVDKYEGKGPVTNEKDINKISKLNLEIMKIVTESETDAKKFIEESPNSVDLERMSKGGLHGATFNYETGEVSLYAPGKEAGFVEGSVGEIETEKGTVPGEKLKLAGDYLDIINQIITDRADKKIFTDYISKDLLPRFQKGGPVEISPMPRFNFSNGGAAGADESFAKELEYYFLNEDAELPQAQSFKETMNPIEILNDMIDPRNLPYYADVLLRSGVRVGEFAGRILPAAGRLASDLIRRPAFKVTGDGGNYVQDYDEVPETNIKGTGIFTEFLENITPTATEKAIGLESLIQTEEQKLKDRRSTIGPKVFADTFGLGLELTAPIFPGLKLLNAYAAAKKLPKDRVTEELLNKEIDQVLAQKGMTRREFLQMSGAGATVALAKMLGIVDFFPKAGKVSRAASKMAMDTQVTGMPAWFKDAVYAIERKGVLKSRGDIKGIEPDFFEMTLNTKAGNKKVLMSKNDNTGEITIDWTTNYYDTEIPVSITYKPGESGYQNLLSDPEFPQSVERYNVEVDAPEFEYKTVDVESMGPEDTSFDSAINLDIREEADAVVEALEELGLTLTKGQKKEAAENFRYYNEVELDEGSGANTQNPLDENDVFTLMDSIKRNQK